MLDRIAQNKPVLERLQPAVSTAAKQSGISENGLKCEMIADPEVIEDLGNKLGVLADL